VRPLQLARQPIDEVDPVPTAQMDPTDRVTRLMMYW
jgi:hypothetical protein